MERKNTLLLTVVSVATLLVAVVGATFAYFTASTTGDGISNVSVTTKSLDVVTADKTDVTMNVALADMLEVNGNDDYSVYLEETSTSSLEIAVGNGGGTATCTYDVVYTPGENQVFDYSDGNTESLKEFTVTGSAAISGTNADKGVSSETAIAEFDLAGIDTATTLLTGASFSVSDADSIAKLTWSFDARFYNLAVDQSSNTDKTFGGTIGITNLSCTNAAE